MRESVHVNLEVSVRVFVLALLAIMMLRCNGMEYAAATAAVATWEETSGVPQRAAQQWAKAR